MSEELQWELYDIFASGIFAFPVYEHSSARRIVRYLLMRGVADEDVANAIEGHTVDLKTWLSRSGKRMVGEWVIAWLNERREDYKYEMHQERGHRRNGLGRNESSPGSRQDRQQKRKRQKELAYSFLDCSDVDDDDDDDDFFDDDFSDDMSSAGTDSFEGSVTSFGSLSSSGVSCKNNIIKKNSITSVAPPSTLNSSGVRSSEITVNKVGRNSLRNSGTAQSDSACWVTTDTNSELDHTDLKRVSFNRDIKCTVRPVSREPASPGTPPSPINQGDEPPVSPSQRRTFASFRRASSNFFGFLPHSSSSSEFSNNSGSRLKKRPHSAQASKPVQAPCPCSADESASSLLTRLTPASSDLSTNIYPPRTWHQAETPSLLIRRTATVDALPTKSCRCTLAHYTRNMCERPSVCQVCHNYEPVEEVQVVPVANGSKRRKGNACMFWKVPWVS